MRALSPTSVRAPFAKYSHGIETAANLRLVVTSGQLGVRADDSVPEGAREQVDQCFANLTAILAEAGATPADVVRLNAYVTDRAHMAGYMAARDAWLADVKVPPAYADLHDRSFDVSVNAN